MNMDKKKKRKLEGDGDMEGEFDEPDVINEQKTVIAQLHTPSSFYHQFRKIMRGDENSPENTESGAK